MKTILFWFVLVGMCSGQVISDIKPIPGMEDTTKLTCRAHDTAYWYPAKIDTVKVIRDSVRSHIDGDHYCYRLIWKTICDTTWAQKVQVWLTPNEMIRLKKMMRESFIADTCKPRWIFR